MENKELEEFDLYRGRLNETLIIWSILNVFRMNEVLVGPTFKCKTETDVEYKTIVLNNLFNSYVYSLFDRRGTDFYELVNLYPIDSDDLFISLQNDITNQYSKIEKSLMGIRNGLGFHGARKYKNLKHGKEAYNNIELTPDRVWLIIHLLIIYCEKLKAYYPTNIDLYYAYNIDELYSYTRLEIKIQEHPKYLEIQKGYRDGIIHNEDYLKAYNEIKQEVEVLL